jgi:16S rRNA (adenine1518-N6/adenine1519-N6)-dimethyltransferase
MVGSDGDRTGTPAGVDGSDDAGREGARDPDALGRRAGVRGDRDQDQHFLTDERVLDRIVGYAEGFDRSHVLEVGAGTGALTDRLVRTVDRADGRVTAIERDRRLVEFLSEEFRAERDAGRLEVLVGDVLDLPLPDYTASVSNLPYGISSAVCFRLLPRKKPLVLTLQREFGERMAAEPGSAEYGRLSVTAGHYADCELLEVIPASVFSPPPAVESCVVRTTPRDPAYEGPSDDAFLDFVTAVFTQRRKTMRNAIRNTTHISGIDNPEAVIDAADESLLGARAGTLPPARFAELATLAASEGNEDGDGDGNGNRNRKS